MPQKMRLFHQNISTGLLPKGTFCQYQRNDLKTPTTLFYSFTVDVNHWISWFFALLCSILNICICDLHCRQLEFCESAFELECNSFEQSVQHSQHICKISWRYTMFCSYWKLWSLNTFCAHSIKKKSLTVWCTWTTHMVWKNELNVEKYLQPKVKNCKIM